MNIESTARFLNEQKREYIQQIWTPTFKNACTCENVMADIQKRLYIQQFWRPIFRNVYTFNTF